MIIVNIMIPMLKEALWIAALVAGGFGLILVDVNIGLPQFLRMLGAGTL